MLQIGAYSTDDGQSYLIRPIQAQDRERIISLFESLSPESRYLRFAHAISKLPDDFLEDILHLDYQREMALVAIMPTPAGHDEMIGIARYVTPPHSMTCEFSISVSDRYASHGIGTQLMLDLIAYAKVNHLKEMVGYVLETNPKMLKLVKDLGFEVSKLDDDPDFRIVTLTL
jgi:GNAT superfamily N-acetyltransferase